MTKPEESKGQDGFDPEDVDWESVEDELPPWVNWPEEDPPAEVAPDQWPHLVGIPEEIFMGKFESESVRFRVISAHGLECGPEDDLIQVQPGMTVNVSLASRLLRARIKRENIGLLHKITWTGWREGKNGGKPYRTWDVKVQRQKEVEA